MKTKNNFILLLLWIMFISGSFFVNLYFIFDNNNLIIKEVSRSFFQEILITRAWNAAHGGVYVPVTDKVKPNEYLVDPERDIITTEGLRLTKVNPAFMTRQIAEIARQKGDVQYHITSLNPIRPANKPDPWEIKALQSFAHGNKESFEMITKDSLKVFRYMAPLFVEKSCLKCHAKQGYKTGQVRGGISVTMKSVQYFSAIRKQIIILGILHALLLLVGTIGILLFRRMINKQFQLILMQNEELQKNIHTKDTLFSLVSHDLKSPLSGAMGLGEIIRKEGNDMTKEEILMLNNLILKSTKQTYQLSEQLVIWYKAQKGTGEFNPEILSIESIVSSCISLLSSKSGEKEIEVSNLVPADLFVNADKNMLAAIFRNLIANALKFTLRGGQVSISANISSKTGFVEIKVEDNGIGMSAETCRALMTYDFQKSILGTENEPGTGIGLTLCKEFIKRHNGELHIESQPGKGSAFIFLLPVSKSA